MTLEGWLPAEVWLWTGEKASLQGNPPFPTSTSCDPGVTRHRADGSQLLLVEWCHHRLEWSWLNILVTWTLQGRLSVP